MFSATLQASPWDVSYSQVSATWQSPVGAPWLRSGRMDSLVEFDAVLIDLIVNSHEYGFDAFQEQEELDEFLFRLHSAAYARQRRPGILFVETFRTCSVHASDCDDHYPGPKQGQLSYNFSGTSRTYHWCNRWWTMASVERPIVQHYHLPIASYREAVWPVISQPRPDLPCLWNGMSHPDASAHLLIADVVTYGFVQSLMHSSSSSGSSDAAADSSDSGQCHSVPLRFHQKQQGPQYCPLPAPNTPYNGVYMLVAEPDGFKPVKASSSWQFRVERKDMPAVWFKFSVPRMTLFMHPKDAAEAGAMGVQVKQLPEKVQAGEFFVAVQLAQGSKFKLLALASC